MELVERIGRIAQEFPHTQRDVRRGLRNRALSRSQDACPNRLRSRCRDACCEDQLSVRDRDRGRRRVHGKSGRPVAARRGRVRIAGRAVVDDAGVLDDVARHISRGRTPEGNERRLVQSLRVVQINAERPHACGRGVVLDLDVLDTYARGQEPETIDRADRVCRNGRDGGDTYSVIGPRDVARSKNARGGFVVADRGAETRDECHEIPLRLQAGDRPPGYLPVISVPKLV